MTMIKGRIYIPGEDTYIKAANLLARGELVSFPTETVYGLGADATNSNAVAGIYKAKNRPDFNPLIVHIYDVAMANRYVKMNDTAKLLAKHFWPGPFTMVLPKKETGNLSDLVSAGLDTVAIRVPEHEVARWLLKRYGKPIAAPSANISGRISPTTAAHVDGEFGDELQMIIDGGACKKGIESTIVKITDDKIVLLRPGNITIEDIEAATGLSVLQGEKEKTPSSPGQLESHYAPKARMRLNVTRPKKTECLLAFGKAPDHPGLNLSPSGNLAEAAANLFSMLRELDNTGYQTIAVSPIPCAGLGLAINDRLKRAAAPKD